MKLSSLYADNLKWVDANIPNENLNRVIDGENEVIVVTFVYGLVFNISLHNEHVVEPDIRIALQDKDSFDLPVVTYINDTFNNFTTEPHFTGDVFFYKEGLRFVPAITNRDPTPTSTMQVTTTQTISPPNISGEKRTKRTGKGIAEKIPLREHPDNPLNNPNAEPATGRVTRSKKRKRS